MLSITGFAEDTTALYRSPEVRLWADGRNVSFVRVESTIRPIDNSLLELKSIVLTSSGFRRLATADSVKIAVGSIRFEVSHTLRTDMRLILDRLSSGSAARPD